MVAYLSKSDASEGFDQIIDFLNGSYIAYALIVNQTIYVSCIKQFWRTIAVKSSNDITRLQALVDKKKVVVTEAAIRDAFHLDDAEGVDCLPNEEIFTKLARMGYEKPSTKLTFYKAFFSSQWKFLIHIILQSMSAKRTSWNEFSSAMASTIICLSTGRKFNFSKYIFEALDACAALARRVEHLEQDKVAQDLEIIKLITSDHATKVLSMQEDESEVQEAVEVVTTAKLITEVIAAISEIVSAAVVFILQFLRQLVLLLLFLLYQVMKKMPLTEEQARRNMMMYLKNTAGFRLDYFKGVTYDDIRPIFVAKFNANMEFLLKSHEQIHEETKRAIKSINQTPAQKVVKRRKLIDEAKEAKSIKQHLQIVPDLALIIPALF
nr:hypothetical protein [Tanacetum cinerariifolium]